MTVGLSETLERNFFLVQIPVASFGPVQEEINLIFPFLLEKLRVFSGIKNDDYCGRNYELIMSRRSLRSLRQSCLEFFPDLGSPGNFSEIPKQC
jgi:hypothetical protein